MQKNMSTAVNATTALLREKVVVLLREKYNILQTSQ